MCRVIGKQVDGLTPAQDTECDAWLTPARLGMDIGPALRHGLARYLPAGLVLQLSTGHIVTPYRGELVPYLNPTMTNERRAQPYRPTPADLQEWIKEAKEMAARGLR